MTDWKTIIKNLPLEHFIMQTDQDSQEYIDQILFACRVGCEEEAPKSPENIYRICDDVAERYNLYPAMRALMKQKWDVESMCEMSLPALQDLFYYMRCLEQIKNRF